MTAKPPLMKNGFPLMQNGKPIFSPCAKCCGQTDGTYNWPKTGYIVGSPCVGGGVWPYNPKVVINAEGLSNYLAYNNGKLPASCITGQLYDSSTNTYYCYSFSYNGTVLQLTQQDLSSGTYIQPNQVSGYATIPDCCDCWANIQCKLGGVGVDPTAIAGWINTYAQSGYSVTVDLPKRKNYQSGLDEWHFCCADWSGFKLGSNSSKTTNGSITYDNTVVTSGASSPFNGYSKSHRTLTWGGTLTRANNCLFITDYQRVESQFEGDAVPQISESTQQTRVCDNGSCLPVIITYPGVGNAPFPYIAILPFGGQGTSGSSYLSINTMSFSASQQYTNAGAHGGIVTTTNSGSGQETVSISSPAICGGCDGGPTPVCAPLIYNGYNITAPPPLPIVIPTDGIGGFLE